MDRRRFLKGFLGTAAISAVPIKLVEAKQEEKPFPEPIDNGIYDIVKVRVVGERFYIKTFEEYVDYLERDIKMKALNFGNNKNLYETNLEALKDPWVAIPANEKTLILVITESGGKFRFYPEWTKENKFKEIEIFSRGIIS